MQRRRRLFTATALACTSQLAILGYVKETAIENVTSPLSDEVILNVPEELSTTDSIFSSSKSDLGRACNRQQEG